MKTRYIYAPLMLILTVSCMSPYPGLNKMEFEDLNYPYDVKYMDVQPDVTLAYVDEGSGSSAILFVHGLGSYLPAWKKNIDGLKSQYRCIAVDLPGYGKSSKPLHSGQMEYYADVLAEFVKKLGLEKVVMAGHSMGGQISIVMALKYPNVVEKLILLDPAGFEEFSEGEKQWFRENLTTTGVRETPVQTIRANLMANFYNMPADAEFMITDRIALRKAKEFERYCYVVARSVHGMVDQPVITLLEKITQPTLIVFGENDNLIPNPYMHGGRTADVMNLGASKIKNGRLVKIPACGHFAQFEKPQEFNTAVSQFLGAGR